jgi:hypothetical protein
MLDLAAWEKKFKESHEVTCPHCGRDYTRDSEFLSDNELITYHGEEGPVKVECTSCDKEFYIDEVVDRTYNVGIELDSNNDIKEITKQEVTANETNHGDTGR